MSENTFNDPAANPADSSMPEGVGTESTDAPIAEDESKTKQPLTPDQQVAADWRAFRIVIGALGVILAALGFYDLFAGTASVPGMDGTSNASLENDYRFLAAFVVGAGASFLAIAIKFGWANLLYVICSTIFLGGLSRVYSWAASGIPTVWMIVLMIVELVIPPVLVVWYMWVRHTEKLRDTFAQPTV